MALYGDPPQNVHATEDDASGSGNGRKSIPVGGKLDGRDNVWKNPRPFEDLPEDVKRLLSEKDRRNPGDGRTTVQKLEGKHMLTLILYLDSLSPVVKSDVYNDISRSVNMASKLNDLYEMGIIEIFGTGRTNTNVILITEKGRKAARMIRELIGIIEG